MSSPESRSFARNPVEDLATLLARGYVRSLARKAVPMAEKGPAKPETGLDDAGEKSVHGERLTDGERR